jgi:hypothetical protein
VFESSFRDAILVVLRVREEVRPQLLLLDNRVPFGVTDDKVIHTSSVGSNWSRVTYN